jgi:hypothetical protein
MAILLKIKRYPGKIIFQFGSLNVSITSAAGGYISGLQRLAYWINVFTFSGYLSASSGAI